jgi:hypothetical protein
MSVRPSPRACQLPIVNYIRTKHVFYMYLQTDRALYWGLRKGCACIAPDTACGTHLSQSCLTIASSTERGPLLYYLVSEGTVVAGGRASGTWHVHWDLPHSHSFCMPQCSTGVMLALPRQGCVAPRLLYRGLVAAVVLQLCGCSAAVVCGNTEGDSGPAQWID